MSDPPLLVACPTYSGKAYALNDYLDAYAALTYEPRHLFMVDNSADDAYALTLRERGVDVARTLPSPTFFEMFVSAWQTILARAEMDGYPYVLSLEQDVIVPPYALDTLVGIATSAGLDAIYHAVPVRTRPADLVYDRGLTLYRTEYLRAQWSHPGLVDGEWPHGAVVTANLFPVRHLDDPGEPWPFDEPDRRQLQAFDDARFHTSVELAAPSGHRLDQRNGGLGDIPLPGDLDAR